MSNDKPTKAQRRQHRALIQNLLEDAKAGGGEMFAHDLDIVEEVLTEWRNQIKELLDSLCVGVSITPADMRVLDSDRMRLELSEHSIRCLLMELYTKVVAAAQTDTNRTERIDRLTQSAAEALMRPGVRGDKGVLARLPERQRTLLNSAIPADAPPSYLREFELALAELNERAHTGPKATPSVAVRAPSRRMNYRPSGTRRAPLPETPPRHGRNGWDPDRHGRVPVQQLFPEAAPA